MCPSGGPYPGLLHFCIVKATTQWASSDTNIIIMQWVDERTWSLIGWDCCGLPITLFPTPQRERALPECPVVCVMFSSFDMIHRWSCIDGIPNNHSDKTPDPFPSDAYLHFFSKHLSWDSEEMTGLAPDTGRNL